MTQKIKDELLADIKYINGLKMLRNKYAVGSDKKKRVQALIDAAETAYDKKRIKHGQDAFLSKKKRKQKRKGFFEKLFN